MCSESCTFIWQPSVLTSRCAQRRASRARRRRQVAEQGRGHHRQGYGRVGVPHLGSCSTVVADRDRRARQIGHTRRRFVQWWTSRPHRPPRPTRPSDALVELRGVDKHFGSLHVLQHIDLTVRSRRGRRRHRAVRQRASRRCAARSTGSRPSTRAPSTLDGKPLPEEGRALARLRADVGMVFQSFNLFAHKTVLRERHARARSRPRASSRRRPRRSPSTCSSGSASRTRPTSCPRSSPAASSSASPSPARSRCSRRSCSSTSRPPRSTPR